jgi:hypothetical protein
MKWKNEKSCSNRSLKNSNFFEETKNFSELSKMFQSKIILISIFGGIQKTLQNFAKVFFGEINSVFY